MGVNAETPVSPLPNMCWYVGLRGDERASTDRACLRRVAAPIMSTWAVPTPWQRVARRNHRRRVRASSRQE